MNLKRKTMKKFRITITDGFVTLSGEFEAKNMSDAMEDARNFYAHELDTNSGDIRVVNIA